MQLGDDNKAGSVGCMDDIAQVNLTQTSAARNGCGDFGVSQIQPSGCQQSFVHQHGAMVLFDQRALGIGLLGCNRIFLKQGEVAVKIDFGIGQQSLVAHKLTFGLGQCRLVGSLSNLGQKLAFPDHLTFLEINSGQFAIDA